MPNVIKRCVGLEFTTDELQHLYPELDWLEPDSHEFFQTATDFLEKSHARNEFKEYGFCSDCEINEISGDGEIIFMEF